MKYLHVFCSGTHQLHLHTANPSDSMSKEFNTGSARRALCQQSINRSISPPEYWEERLMRHGFGICGCLSKFHVCHFPSLWLVILWLHLSWTHRLSFTLARSCQVSSLCHTAASDVRVLLLLMLLCRQFQVSEVFFNLRISPVFTIRHGFIVKFKKISARVWTEFLKKSISELAKLAISRDFKASHITSETRTHKKKKKKNKIHVLLYADSCLLVLLMHSNQHAREVCH